MPRPWPAKFASAFRGIIVAIRTERSFAVHVPMAVAVFVAAAVLRVSLLEAGLLSICVALVLAAEMFNTAIELLARFSKYRLVHVRREFNAEADRLANHGIDRARRELSRP